MSGLQWLPGDKGSSNKQASCTVIAICPPGDCESPTTAGADGGLLCCQLHLYKNERQTKIVRLMQRIEEDSPAAKSAGLHSCGLC
jgi:hypothetical protein